MEKKLQPPSIIENQVHDLTLEIRFVKFTTKRGVDDEVERSISVY